MSPWDWLRSVNVAWWKSPCVSIAVRFQETGWTQERRLRMGNWKFFGDEEVKGLDTELVAMLDMAHGIANQAMAEATGNPKAYVNFILTATTGGQHAANSAHYKGLAVDVGLGHLDAGFERNTQRWAILKGLFGAGFKRIEICELHLHADRGEAPDYVSPTSWIGTDS